MTRALFVREVLITTLLYVLGVVCGYYLLGVML